MTNCEFTCKPCDGDCPPAYAKATADKPDTMLTEHVSDGDAARLLFDFHLQDVESEVPLLHRLIAYVGEQYWHEGYTAKSEGN